MTHLIISREYPPSIYPQGGIGTYVHHIARLLAGRGDTVHVIGELWADAPHEREALVDGRLIVHRVPLDRPLPLHRAEPDPQMAARIVASMGASAFPAQRFAWQAGLLAESLVETEGIDLIEGQDYEAPLYYFLLRRAVGLGPDRRPPCVVHLHSPMEFICRHNDWDIGRPDYLSMKRLEEYVIMAADAWLCPSRSLTADAEAYFDLPRGSVEHIPLPIGDTPRLERSSETWRSGPICYFGRMEPRKGVFEWIEAAVTVARERPGLRFELTGGDAPLTGHGGYSVRAALEARVPDEVREGFRFAGPEPRSALWRRLERARVAVVPSRWENFPNTCVEAMRSGLPVLASRCGGMADMIEDGRTGWLASSQRPEGLAEALRRALDTPADRLAAMGRDAADSIGRLCDNDAILDRHVDFRRRVVAAGARRSLHVPPPWSPGANGSTAAGRIASYTRVRGEASIADGRGIAMVITGGGDGRLEECLATVSAQTEPPHTVVIVTDDAADAPAARAEQLQHAAGWCVLRPGRVAAPAAAALGIRAVLTSGNDSLGIAILDAGCRLEPQFVSACRSALTRNPQVGIVSSWFAAHHAPDATAVHPRPALPYQWVFDEASPCCAFRADAIRELHWIRDAAGIDPAPRDLVLAALVHGWDAVTYPALLARAAQPEDPASAALATAAHKRIRAALMARFPDLVARDAPFLLLLLDRASVPAVRPGTASAPSTPQQPPLTPAALLRKPWSEQVQLAGRALRHPRYAASWIAHHGRQALRDARHRAARWRTGDRTR